MNDWKALRRQVLEEVKPSAAATREARQASARLARDAKKVAAELGFSVVPALVGSLAKGTHLRPAPDIDVFLLFPVDTPRDKLEEIGVRVGKKVLRDPVLKYAEHPYVHGRRGRFAFDVVPAYRIRDAKGRMSAVDRSPFHAAYVRRKLKPNQRDEVRILKRFLKGAGCYGAETATSAFSGYLAELLVLKFRSFEGVVRAFADPSPPRRLALGSGSPGVLGGELVFVDPVDTTRNAAAAVGQESLARFVRACRAFAAAPAREFFFPREPKPATAATLADLLARRGVAALDLPVPAVREDAVGPHLRRLRDKIARRLVDEGFVIRAQRVEPARAGRMLVLFEHEPRELPDTFEHRGPPVDDADNSRRFLQKWQGHPDAINIPHPIDGRWQVRVRRHERTPAAILGPHLPMLLEGVELKAAQRRSARFREANELLGAKSGRRALTKLLLPKDPWEA